MALQPLTVRAVTPGDFAGWEPLWRGYNLFYGRDQLPAEITHMTWSRFFDAYEPVHALVAEQAGRLVGLVHYLFHRSTIQIEPICYLQDLYTDEAARNQGVGRTLIAAVYERAGKSGCKRVYWLTRENNLTAMRLYDKLADRSGFIVYRKQLHFAD
jgi:GNAT superfamily N-acetyltransferase